jgi:hypothetical protein
MAQDGAKRVPMEVRPEFGFLSWVASAGGCLRALGCECDKVDVAGHSGYAFHMCVNSAVDVSGPTTLPWSDLADGLRSLGRSTMSYQVGPYASEGEDWKGGEPMCLELAKREVDAGRPSVLYGAAEPEFVIVVGYEGNEWLFLGLVDGQEYRVANGDLKDPYGPYLLMFPSTSHVKPVVGDRVALVNALNFLHRRPAMADQRFGLAAYDHWIAALQAKRSTAFGGSYAAESYSQGRQYARDFIGRLTGRNPHAAGPLDEAHIAYQECAEAMVTVARLIPFPRGAGNTEDPVTITQACEALAAARDAETRAAAAIEKALEAEWPTA